jgi:hypothetical protein
MKTAGTVVLFVLLFGIIVLGARYWILTLQRVSREETDPKERRKWWLRVFFFRVMGILWYENHRRKIDGAR